MTKFDKIYNEIMEMVVGDVYGGGSGEHGGDFLSSDWYAPGDARVPTYLGAKKKKKKGKKKKKNQMRVNDMVVPVQRRAFPKV